KQMLVAKAGEPILAPAISAAAGVVVREILPGRAAGAVILTHRAPLTVTDIGPPKPPRRIEPSVFEPAALGGFPRTLARRATAALSRRHQPANPSSMRARSGGSSHAAMSRTRAKGRPLSTGPSRS